ncbi:DUF1367 family protein [Pasteurellaceae bacterium HPA106]|uniref:DUF1367 family protein n=1 Tax=Spirabiliibacterium pneumoniae TaxID=221400 RepID=UPI001AAD5A66|nr:DUF1367 family protein [Spirabiliibacterium pneumoniae]MBE2895726.1 DUF1367 family protein [Spirabiliibacterium pneumoniae]
MKIELIKRHGGVFEVADDMYLEDITKLKTGDMFTADIKLKVNPKLHRMMFAFFKFCFEYYCADHGFKKYSCQSAQFDEFREWMTIQAGHCEMVFDIRNNGKFKLRAKSISFEKFPDDTERQKLYSALVNAALATVFKDCKDEDVINQLYSFF